MTIIALILIIIAFSLAFGFLEALIHERRQRELDASFRE